MPSQLREGGFASVLCTASFASHNTLYCESAYVPTSNWLFLKAHLRIIDSFPDDLGSVRILDSSDSQKTATHLSAIMTRVISIVTRVLVRDFLNLIVPNHSFACRESRFESMVATTSVRKILKVSLPYLLLNTKHNIYGATGHQFFLDI
jgi:hypothetical protein